MWEQIFCFGDSLLYSAFGFGPLFRGRTRRPSFRSTFFSHFSDPSGRPIVSALWIRADISASSPGFNRARKSG